MFQEAADEIIAGVKIEPEEPVRTEFTYTQVRNDRGFYDTVRERWDLDLEGNNKKLAIAQEEYVTLKKLLKRLRSYLFHNLFKCLTEEMKNLVRMEKTDYAEALREVSSFDLYKIIKRVAEHSLIQTAGKTLIKYTNAKWNRATTTLNHFILEMERMVDQLNDAGKEQSDEDRTARLAEAIMPAGVEFVNRALFDTVIKEKTRFATCYSFLNARTRVSTR